MEFDMVNLTKLRAYSVDKLLFYFFGYLILFGFALMCFIPFYLIFINSFMDEASIIREGFSFFPKKFSVEGYQNVFKNPTSIINAYKTTVFITIAGTFLALFTVTMTGFVLSRRDFYYRNLVSFFFYFTTLFSGGLVPYYLFCTRGLHLNNKLIALVIPTMFSVWNMIITKNFFKAQPFEIIESAKIDGANDFTIYYKLILPISTPLLATIGLFTSLTYWNDWYHCMLFISSKYNHLYTLQYYLQSMLNSAREMARLSELSGMDFGILPMESMKMAMTVIATGPMLLAYPFIQKYFVKGLTVGSVKG
jgi:putative aldouronate transport system permease protein